MNTPRRRHIPAIALAVLALSFGIAVAVAIAVIVQKWTGLVIPVIWNVFIGSFSAVVLGKILGLPNWWIPINGLAPLAAYLSLSLGVPAWVYLLCFIVLALVYWNAAGERVPLYLSNTTTWRAVEELSKGQAGPFMDVGCGFGGILFFLAKRHPDRSFVGIESAPIPYVFAKLRQILTKATNVDIRYGDIWQADFSSFATIYAFLSPSPMHRLYEKISREMGTGSLFISNSFSVAGIEPSQSHTLNDGRKTKLLIWQM